MTKIAANKAVKEVIVDSGRIPDRLFGQMAVINDQE